MQNPNGDIQELAHLLEHVAQVLEQEATKTILAIVAAVSGIGAKLWRDRRVARQRQAEAEAKARLEAAQLNLTAAQELKVLVDALQAQVKLQADQYKAQGEQFQAQADELRDTRAELSMVHLRLKETQRTVRVMSGQLHEIRSWITSTAQLAELVCPDAKIKGCRVVSELDRARELAMATEIPVVVIDEGAEGE